MSPRSDREAHGLILRWCRGDRPQGAAVHPVMREGVPLMYPDRPRCCVFDLGRSDRLVAGGATWEEVAAAMGL